MLLVVESSLGFILEGSLNSYAEYPPWSPTQDGSLDFLFSTTEPDGLLFYTDNENTAQFFQLSLVEGTARLRYNLGHGPRLVSAGRNLNDGFWHHVRVQRTAETTELRVDDSVETHQGPPYDSTFGGNGSTGGVYFGGIPTDVPRLSGSVVSLQPRFVGKIKDVIYRAVGGVKRPEMTASL
ncbi:Laminin G domain, partial [Trinorchestia longiramus]